MSMISDDRFETLLRNLGKLSDTRLYDDQFFAALSMFASVRNILGCERDANMVVSTAEFMVRIREAEDDIR